MTLNKVMIIGNAGKDPEIRHLDNGVSVITLPVATTERYKDKYGEPKEQTEWHNVVFWRNLAEFVEKYVKKGSQIFIEGRLRTRSWEDAQGNKKYATEIVADNIRLLGKRSDNNNNNNNSNYNNNNNSNNSTATHAPAQTAEVKHDETSTANNTSNNADDDLPF